MPDFTAIALSSTSIQVSWNMTDIYSSGVDVPPGHTGGINSLNITQTDPLGNPNVQNPPLPAGPAISGTTVFTGLSPNTTYIYSIEAVARDWGPPTYNNYGINISCTSQPIDGLNASWTDLAHLTITVNWTNAPNTKSIVVKLVGANQGVPISRTLDGSISTAPFVVPLLDNYTITLTSTDTSGVSSPSNSIFLSGLQPPGAVTLNPPTWNAPDYTQITVTWTDVPNATSYDVQLIGARGETYQSTQQQGQPPKAIFQGVNPDVYTITVTASNASGNTSVHTTLSAPPAAVIGLKAHWNAPEYNEIIVSWANATPTSSLSTQLNVQLIGEGPNAKTYPPMSVTPTPPGGALQRLPFPGVAPGAYNITVTASNALGTTQVSTTVLAPPAPAPATIDTANWNAPDYNTLTVGYTLAPFTTVVSVTLVGLVHGKPYPNPISMGSTAAVFSGVVPDSYTVTVTVGALYSSGTTQTNYTSLAPLGPGSVTGLKAQWNSTFTGVIISCIPAAAGSGTPPTGFQLLRFAGSFSRSAIPDGDTGILPSMPQSDTPKIITGTSQYQYQLIVSNAAGTSKAVSNVLAPPPKPGVVSGLTASWNAPAYTEITISWEPAAAGSGSLPTGFQLSRFMDHHQPDSIQISSSPYPDTAPLIPPPGINYSFLTYLYGLRANNNFGSSPMVLLSQALKPPPILTAPTVTLHEADRSTPASPLVDVEWTPVHFAVSYDVTVIKSYFGDTTTQVFARGLSSGTTICQVPLEVAEPLAATYKFQVTANTTLFGSLSGLSAPWVIEMSKQSQIHIIKK